MKSLKGSRPLFNTKTWIRRRRAADRDTARKIGCFIDPRIYIFYDNFYLNTIKPYIHPNRLSILFPTRLCWVFFDIAEANYGVLLQNPVLVLRRPQVVPLYSTRPFSDPKLKISPGLAFAPRGLADSQVRRFSNSVNRPV